MKALLLLLVGSAQHRNHEVDEEPRAEQEDEREEVLPHLGMGVHHLVGEVGPAHARPHLHGEKVRAR